ncbi:MAG TPA: hypothetical protein VM284_03685 [Candidatus Limnocylindria bacterium]|nr:hypothetical protein [Candidatus Limnocylindria bacterium]
MRAGHELLSPIPDPWRRWLTLRRVRRWLRAVRFERRHNRALPANSGAVSFHPMRIEPAAAIAHVLPRLGLRIAAFGSPAAATFAWETGTWLSPGAEGRLPAGAINRECRDISKSTVDRLWAEVTGYSIEVDPRATHGAMVVKPIINGVRGGRILTGPLGSPRKGYVYQKLIDCRVDGRLHTLRPVIFGERILLVYEKWRAPNDWFSGAEEVRVKNARDVFTAHEQGQLLRFASAIGLGYGELDVLRAADTGLIYVVDANRTPIRPRGLKAADEDAAFGPLADALASHMAQKAG